MEESHSVADSHAWEQKCKQLLAIRYRDELQLIDASRAGDLGLEAFTRDSACAFQCYAALEPLRLDIPPVGAAQRADWAAEHVPLVETLDAKINKFGVAAEQQTALRDEFLNHYLRREQLLGQIFNEAPETYARIERRIRD